MHPLHYYWYYLRSACCGFDLCHKYVLYLYLSILSPGQGWYRSAKAQNSTKAPLTGNPNQLGPHSMVDTIWNSWYKYRCKLVWQMWSRRGPVAEHVGA